ATLHPPLHIVYCGTLWAGRRLAGKPRLNTKLLLGWSDLAEGGVDESVIGDLHTAGHEKWHAERRDAERKAAQHGRKRARDRSRGVGDPGSRRPLVSID